MTVSEIVSLARGHFETFDSGEALALLQPVHNALCRQVRVRPDESVSLLITAGVSEYAVPDALRIWDVCYMKDASSSVPLRPRSVDELDYGTYGAWRREAGSSPVWYDERAGNLVLYPAPSVTSSGGYPKVVVTVSKSQTLEMATALPDAVCDHEAWLYGLCRRYAAMKSPDKVQMFVALEKDSLQRLKSYSQGKAIRQKPNVRSSIPRVNVV